VESFCLQCYTHARGGDGAIFRNEYAIQNLAFAEVSLSTWKLSKYLLNVSDAEVEESVNRSHNEGINKILGRITEEVARHLEVASKSRVTKLVCDYVIDEQDEPQLLWVHDILVAPRHVVPAHGANQHGTHGADDPSLTLSESTFADRRHRQVEEEKKADDVYATYDDVVGRAVGDGWRGKICVCDSDALASVSAMHALVDQGYSIKIVADGPKALQATRDDGFDALLIARDLPSVSGVEVTRIIRQREGALAHTAPGTLQMRLPIIAFTEHTTAEDLRIYMEVGMDGCICKPLEIGSLLNTVAAAVPLTEGRAPPASGTDAEGKMPSSATELSAVMGRSMPAGQSVVGRSQKLAPSSPVGTRKLADTQRSARRPRGRVTQGPPVLNSAMEAPVSEQGDVISGVFQLDAETAIPYAILGKSMEGAPVFHFVVLQDIFETCEVWQIFFRKIVAKYPGMRVLLFNYPGQAFTEWRRDATLNNEYLAGVTEALLGYLSKHGNGEFALEDGQAPFYLMGVGNGGAIASSFVTTYMGRHPNLRGLLLLNGHLYLDAHLAGVYHDCMNVFACTPASRPDLPVYFFSRYLFSPTYLSKVGAPLALNLYTAVHNPITLEGRIQLCQGALSHVDVRDTIERLSLPIISVASSKDGFIKPLHVQAAIACRGGEERSIKRVLTTRRRVCVIWLRAGHELLQEARRPLSNLVEQLATGYHERNDVAFLPLAPEQPTIAGGTRGYQPPSLAAKAAARATQRAGEMTAQLDGMSAGHASTNGLAPGQPTDQAQLYEDKYLDDVVSTLHEAQGRGESKTKDGSMVTMVEELEAHKNLIDGGVKSLAGTNKMGKAVAMGSYGDEADYQAMASRQYADADATQTTSYPVALDDAPPVPDELKEWQAAIARGEKPRVKQPKMPFSGFGFDASGQGKKKRTSLARAQEKRDEMRQLNVELNLDPEAAMFERRDNDNTLGSAAQTVPAHPEVREYMAWRLKRNKKRYTRIVQKVEMVQRAWRSYLSRTLLVRMRQQRSALNMQRWWRGCVGRKRVAHMRREHWAAHVVQRYWRGFAGRGLAWKMQLEERSARLIQKCWRGWRARRFVNLLRFARRDAAIKIQSMWRQRVAMRDAWAMRDRHNAAVNIQRIFRGRLGRARAKREREKYLFSKSQSQSIEFGRQMLMEHKLHATKLQSEVSILTKEKIETEEAVEMVLKEISTFEAGVRALEKEMIDLSRAEAEAAGTLDEEAKLELRENKMRLDREFGAMLVKIADRREKLQGLEKKLQRIDATREAKKEELQDLERKLVVLLEEQQRELKAIKIRQTRKGERLVDDAVKAVQETLASGGKTPLQIGRQSNNAGSQGGQASMTDLSELGGGPTPQQRAEANALMSSTETMMKFGFMSMSMTYFSSLNMIRAMRQVGTANTVLANPMLAGGTMSALNRGLVGQGSLMDGSGGTAASFQPGLKPGQVAGQETSDVSLWTVGDVANWLDTLALGQYKDAFADAAVDGAFMFDLTDDDLRSTLGIEHALHRKKILSAISRLRSRERDARAASEAASMSASAMMMRGDASSGMGGPSGMLGAMSSIGPSASMAAGRMPDQGYGQYGDGTVLSGGQDSGSMLTAPMQAMATGIRFQDMMQWVSFGKAKKVANALRTLPDQKFDLGLLKAQFVDGFGTQYDDSLAALDFHTNLADEHGNTLLLKCAQSGQGHLAKLLVQHGAYINHQNARGNTALHFALMYKDTDLAVWLADPDKGGIDDTLLNADGLSAYDGLSADDA